MPVDADGNRAELIMDGVSTIKRMNVSRLIEQYLNAASRDVTKRLQNMDPAKSTLEDYENILLSYYRMVNPEMVELVTDDEGRLKKDHLDHVLKDGIYLWTPTNNERESMDIIRDIHKHFKPTFGPIQYRGMSGNIVTTKKDILIGSMYIILLEKTGRNWAGVSSSKLSHFGVPAKISSSDKHAMPGRMQPIRFGESEARAYIAFVGGEHTAELFDRTNNPVKRKVIQENILRADKPTNIPEVVNRKQYPSGHGRIHSLVRHFGECAGWRYKRVGK